MLALGFKNLYLRKSLHLENDDVYLNTLVNTMCIFDNKFDKIFLKRQVDLKGEICIDGYYNFRMKRLKSKWDELIAVVKNNSALLGNNSLIKEFLCYLLDFFSQSQQTISVVIDDDSFALFDEHGKLIPATSLVYPTRLEELVVINAILLKPNHINLYCDSANLQSGFLDLLSYLFDVKIVENS